MSFRLGIAQTGFPTDEDVPQQVRGMGMRARQRNVDLLVFPENLMCPHDMQASELIQLAEPLDGAFANSVLNVAYEHGLWIVFTMLETNPAGGPPFNTAVVAGSDGDVYGTYRKCHLYDAHSVRESDRMTAGRDLCLPVRTPFCTLGIGICYDLRFPEVARCLALAGCDVLVYPAAWHDGPNKPLHWRTLLAARAIENECFVAGACHGDERYVGESHVFDPLGNAIATGSAELLVADVDPRAVDAARDAMPVFAHRRPELY